MPRIPDRTPRVLRRICGIWSKIHSVFDRIWEILSKIPRIFTRIWEILVLIRRMAEVFHVFLRRKEIFHNFDPNFLLTGNQDGLINLKT